MGKRINMLITITHHHHQHIQSIIRIVAVVVVAVEHRKLNVYRYWRRIVCWGRLTFDFICVYIYREVRVLVEVLDVRRLDVSAERHVCFWAQVCVCIWSLKIYGRLKILFVELSKCVFHQVHSKQAVAVVFGKHCTLFNVMTSDNLSEILTIKPGFNFKIQHRCLPANQILILYMV